MNGKRGRPIRKPQRIIAIDIGTQKCGFSYWEEGQLLWCEQWYNDLFEFKKMGISFKIAAETDFKTYAFYNKVKDVLIRFGFTENRDTTFEYGIIYEQPNRFYNAIARISEYVGILRMLSCHYSLGLPVNGYPTTTIKKGFVGKGTANKEEVQEEARIFVNVTIGEKEFAEIKGEGYKIGEDEADSIALGYFYFN